MTGHVVGFILGAVAGAFSALAIYGRIPHQTECIDAMCSSQEPIVVIVPRGQMDAVVKLNKDTRATQGVLFVPEEALPLRAPRA